MINLDATTENQGPLSGGPIFGADPADSYPAIIYKYSVPR